MSLDFFSESVLANTLHECVINHIPDKDGSKMVDFIVHNEELGRELISSIAGAIFWGYSAISNFVEDEVPKQALTMGLGEIMKARKIILLANGANKHDALIALLNCKEVTKDLPASVLINHPDVTIICESEAYGK